MKRTDHPSPLGALTLVSNGVGLVGVYFDGHRVGGAPKAAVAGTDAVLAQAGRELDAYFAGRRRTFETPLALFGSPFQVRVWSILQRIPYGGTMSYGAIAAELGMPNGARAVGAATRTNPISIMVPCHRVLGARDALTGYAGGLERKKALLELEGATATQTRLPV